MPEKRRVDRLLVERGLAPSRERAQALILAGQVFARERIRLAIVGPVDGAAEKTIGRVLRRW